jgi:hypothetical protein
LRGWARAGIGENGSGLYCVDCDNGVPGEAKGDVGVSIGEGVGTGERKASGEGVDTATGEGASTGGVGRGNGDNRCVK